MLYPVMMIISEDRHKAYYLSQAQSRLLFRYHVADYALGPYTTQAVCSSGQCVSASVGLWYVVPGDHSNLSLTSRDIAKSTICDVLRNGLHAGKLMIQDGDQTLEFGSQAVNSPTVVIRVLDPHFWARIYFDHDLGCQ